MTAAEQRGFRRRRSPRGSTQRGSNFAKYALRRFGVARPRNAVWRLSGARIKVPASCLSVVSRAGHLGRVSRRGRKVSYLCRSVKRGKNPCKSLESRSVYLMGLRGSDGGRLLRKDVPVHLRAPRPSIPTGRGSRKRDGSRDEGNIRIGKRGDRIRRLASVVSPSRGGVRGMSFGFRGHHRSLFNEGVASIARIPIRRGRRSRQNRDSYYQRGRCCKRGAELATSGKGTFLSKTMMMIRDLVPDRPGRVTPARC